MLSTKTSSCETRSPDSAKIRNKMMYSSSKDNLRKRLPGSMLEIPATDREDISYETCMFPSTERVYLLYPPSANIL